MGNGGPWIRATVALSETYNAYLTDHIARLLGVAWVPVAS